MLKLRIITAVALIIGVGLLTMLTPPIPFSLALGAVILWGGWEWSRLVGLVSRRARLGYVGLLLAAGGLLFAGLGTRSAAAILNPPETMGALGLGMAFWLLILLALPGYPANRARWDSASRIGAMGVLALLPSLAGMVWLKLLLPEGYLVLALIVLVAAVDIGAYFTGRSLGKRQLAPAISPNKTWEGVWGGFALCLLAAAAMGWALHHWLRPLETGEILLLAVLAPLVAALCVIGDLLESMLKRNRDAKDSGSLLPGHGGLLDRIDGLLAATPAFALGMTWLFR